MSAERLEYAPPTTAWPAPRRMYPRRGEPCSARWSEAHRVFHRTLLAGCGNRTLLETFDRMWTASELARRWSAQRAPGRDHVGEYRRLEETALTRDADAVAEVLAQHLTLTAAGLADSEAFSTSC
ncbi:DNA-binding GntR family transcriptional regulator [Streptomyces nodosus]|nr:DNA-binding GntR family transcriptional regulator [Streptomyces nodosus]